MVSLTQLEYVLAVEEHRHFAKAAQACHVSQPTLSMQLQKLEDDLKLIVFDRSKKPILPTREGKLLIQQAKEVMRSMKKLVDISQLREGHLTGPFRLAVIPTLAPDLVPRFVESFSQNYPEVQLYIDEMKTEDILTALDEDRVDGGLLVTPVSHARLNVRVLFYEPFHLYVSTEHPLSKKTKISEADLDGRDVWLMHEGHCLRNQVIKICSLNSKEGVFKNVHFESGNLETLKELVRRTRGYTLLPHLLVERLSADEKKRRVRAFRSPLPTREVSLVYRRDHWKTEILDALQNLILHNIPKELLKLNKNNIEIVELDI